MIFSLTPTFRVSIVNVQLIVCSMAMLFSCCTLKLQAQAEKSILVQNYYYPKAGKDKEVYEWRLHASEVRVKLGLLKGMVLKKVSGETGPYVIWQCEYPSMEARETEVKKLDQSEEFKKVQEHMGTLIEKFERTAWEIDR